jgi:hypothetical protein
MAKGVKKFMPCPVCDQWSTVTQTIRKSTTTTQRRYRCANEHVFSTLSEEIIIRVGRGKLCRPLGTINEHNL